MGLKSEIVKMFERKTPFYKTMQKARKWQMSKETFGEYAIEKLILINRMDLPVKDQIHLLISGIPSNALRATALSNTAGSVEKFLEKIRPVMEGSVDAEKTLNPTAKENKNKTIANGV